MVEGKRAATTAANRRRVLEVARRLLERDGAAALSLREVAREMGQSSSALYRYFANRDELLTALIIDAYNDLGAAVEAAESAVPRGRRRARLLAAARAARAWALAHRHEYSLIFGSPVPGYVAPQATIPAATRVTVVLAGIVEDQYSSGPRRTRRPASLAHLLEWEGVESLMVHVPPDVARRAVLAWTELFGMISFELFGHYVAVVADLDGFFDAAVATMADLVGLDT